MRTPEGTTVLQATIGRNRKRSPRRQFRCNSPYREDRFNRYFILFYIFHAYKLNFVQELASRSAFGE